ncbi:MAG TPA: hypothetical protein VHC43_08050 [Mycobacteriales bacterium]|nr:hypothetical protein [Mycobacteriales bacterium]
MPVAPPPGDAFGVPGAPVPGMPGYSWHQHQQVRAEVAAHAPPAVPMSSGTVLAAVAGLGGLLMVVGGWAPWVKVGVGTFVTQSVAGHERGLHGLLVLALGVAALLAAGTAVTAQSNRQLRQICAGSLVALGAVGLVTVIHDWTTLTDHFRKLNDFIASINQYAIANGAAPGSTLDFTLHIAKQWGLVLSGVATVVTGLAGVFLFLA